MINAGQMTEMGLARIEDAKRSGEWARARTREHANEAPPELKRALAANKAARRNFDDLAPSYRRQYIGWLLSAKREETRRKRIKEIVRLLTRNRKMGMR